MNILHPGAPSSEPAHTNHPAPRPALLLAVILAGLHGIARATPPPDPQSTPPTPSLAEPSRDGADESRVTRHLHMAHTMPDHAVFQGTLDKEQTRYYLYRNPTRVERFRRSLFRGGTQIETSTDKALATGAGVSGRSPLRINPPFFDLTDPAFGGALFLLALSLTGLGWIDHQRKTPRSAHAVESIEKQPPPLRHRITQLLTIRSHKRKRTRPAPWIDPWTRPEGSRALTPTADHARPNTPDRLPLAGSIETLGLDSVIQILIHESQTGALVVSSENHECLGSFQFCEGQLVGVHAGKLAGEDAACRLLGINNGFYELRKIPIDANRKAEAIDAMSLLLEAHRRLDEQRA